MGSSEPVVLPLYSVLLTTSHVARSMSCNLEISHINKKQFFVGGSFPPSKLTRGGGLDSVLFCIDPFSKHC